MQEKNEGPLTVKKLREMLDFQEANWDQVDVQYLGKFEDITIMCEVYDCPAFGDIKYKGVGHSQLEFNYELGITVIPSLWRPNK
jgi:hypothetical protein